MKKDIKTKGLEKIKEEIVFLRTWDGDCIPPYYNIMGQLDLFWYIGVISEQEYDLLMNELNEVMANK